MTDLVERLLEPVAHERREGFYTVTTYAPDPLRAEAASRISQQDAELERVRREVEEADEADQRLVDKYRDPQNGKFNFPGDVRELAEARKAAFIEAAEIAKNVDVELSRGCEGIGSAAYEAQEQIVAALRRKTEEVSP